MPSSVLESSLRIVLGDEELLARRAVEEITVAARRADSAAEIREITAAEVSVSDLMTVLSPSLFMQRRVLVVSGVDAASTEIAAALTAYADDPMPETTVVLLHSGGGRNRALLAAFRDAGAAEVTVAKLKRPEDRIDFVRMEVRRAGGQIDPPAAAALLDAVGTDLRELAATCEQLVFDSGGRIDLDVVTRYHRGRAEVTGFNVADRAVVGDGVGALETLRWALSVGVAHVLIADALADGVRSIARVSTSPGSNPYTLAGTLGMPPWKVKRAQSQARGWSERGLVQALGIAAEVNADVKGVAVDPSYALEKAIRRLVTARRNAGT